MVATTGPDGPAVRAITGDEAGQALAAATGSAGGEMLGWRRTQVTYRPDHGTTVTYRVRVRWPGGLSAEETMVACTGELPAGVLVLDDGHRRIGVWRVPHDPDLPGLPVARDEAAVRSLLARWGVSPGPVELRTLSYRPRRRAVVEARGPWGRLFLKVVRPEGVKPLHELHRSLVDHGLPVPPSAGWSPDGILVLEPLPGRTLREQLRLGGPVPSGSDLTALLDRLPAESTLGRPRPSWLASAPRYAQVVATTLPSAAAQAEELARVLADGSSGPVIPGPVHGDFYEKQLLVQGGRICGVLDVDTVGPGDRLDDLACLLGHLSVLATHQDPGGTVHRVMRRYLSDIEQRVPSAALRRRIAAVVLSLATGPYRVQEKSWPATTRRRVELAAAWVASVRGRQRAV